MPPATAERPPLILAFGRDAADCFDVGVPVLGGNRADDLFATARPAGRAGSFALFETAGWLTGVAVVPAEDKAEPVTRRLYRELLQATRGRHLARIWNFVPDINETGGTGLENYQAFCRGRSLAFEQHHGAAFTAFVPAASAVGCRVPALTVAFAASAAQPRHVENPAQVPAYDYPGDYGPRSPSFARATIVPGEAGATVFISGTAAIRGHATVAPDRLDDQLDCTLKNLDEISRVCGLRPQLDRGGPAGRHFKVYVRHAADQPRIAATLAARLFGPGDRVCYLHADICRQALLVEVEATLVGVTAPPGGH